jgi:ATP/maltotriose-dependent transcriptional regulator MalT
MGERALLATVAAELARAVCAQGRYEEAEELTRVSEELARPLDVAAQVSWRTVRAACNAGKDDLEGAESLAREALEAVEQTDDLNRHARVLVGLADVVERSGREGEAASLREQALALYERRGNVVSARSLRDLARSPQ